jgi:hypothetical protein
MNDPFACAGRHTYFGTQPSHQQTIVEVGVGTTGVYDPGPTAVGSPVDGSLPGSEDGSIGLAIGAGEPSGFEEGSIGDATTPMPLGAIRLGIRSKVGWNCRRERMVELLPKRAKVNKNMHIY